MSLEIDLGEVRRLEQLAFRGWPALETRDIAGWRLRFAGGYTKRANSINSLGHTAQSDPQTVANLESVYRERGLAPVWRLTPLAPTAIRDLLVEPAYRVVERSQVQVAPLAARFAPDPAVRIDARPSARWIEAFAKHSPVAPHHRETMQRMLPAMPKAGFALVEQSGEPLAMAIGVVDGEHMGLFDVLVMPQARRQGLARRITQSLYAWAWSEGARFAYLQVVATNAAALPLYAAQGFRTVYQYEYRVPSLA
ncbi:MAG: GNAT family N-acetyltransferase [Alphaproteobacteria bacterium]|nr:GNAT family N-acetyltransferase [Alphaproteobacteria bacterium]MBV8413427.1 GNAT family N-acetyltransferase [Alphaproteobacteria bacterium]